MPWFMEEDTWWKAIEGTAASGGVPAQITSTSVSICMLSSRVSPVHRCVEPCMCHLGVIHGNVCLQSLARLYAMMMCAM